MKILTISFKNLNSLKGEWHIDLNHSLYTSEGIFAITGPTGAGKTTIFDAVCLALYGQTPRLESVGGQNNEIMSKGTGECYAKVTFSTDKGIFTCRWEQTRAYKYSQGKLQSIKHEIEDEHTPLATKHEETLKAVERITGMDFKRFTQAMMLEQGGFDAFLKADNKERARILELITGTDIYSRISMLVYQRSKEEKIKLADINARIEENKSQLGASITQDINAELEKCIERIPQLEASHNETGEARECLREIQKLRSELEDQQKIMSRYQKEFKDFEHDRIKLEAFERAESIRHVYLELETSRKAHAASQNLCGKFTQEISNFEAETAKLEAELPCLDAKIESESHGFTELPDVVMQRINSAVDKYEEAAKAQKKLDEDVTRAERIFAQARVEANKKLAARNLSREKMNAASQEHRKATGELMQMRAKTTKAVIAEERTKLIPGKPCPLCGSIEHPGFKHENNKTPLQNSSSEELFRRSEILEAKLKQLEVKTDEAERDFDRASEEYNQAVSSESNAQTRLERLREELEAKKIEVGTLHSAARKAVQGFDLTGVKYIDDIKSLVKKCAEELNKLIKLRQDKNSELEQLRTRLDETSKNLDRESENLNLLTKELQEVQSRFESVLREKKFADEKDFCDSLIAPEKNTLLQTRRRNIDDNISRTKALFENIKKKLDKKISEEKTGRTLEEIIELFNNQENEIQSINARIAVLRENLKTQSMLQEKIRELEQQCIEQEKISNRWTALNSMIGSAQGDVFRIFAQKSLFLKSWQTQINT